MKVYNYDENKIIAIEMLTKLYDNIHMLNKEINNQDLEGQLYEILSKLFKSIMVLDSKEQFEFLKYIKISLKKIERIESNNNKNLELKELNNIIYRILNDELEESLKLIWYYIYKKSVYTIKVFDTENLDESIILKCAWYAALFKLDDSIEIRNTKFYLFDKKNGKKFPIEVQWGSSSYYKYDFPHENIVNPYDNMKLIIDFKLLSEGEFEIFYEVFGQRGKVIISNAAVTRKLYKRILTNEKIYKYINFRTSSRIIYIGIKVKEKTLINLYKIKLNQFRYDIRLIGRLDNRRFELLSIYIFFKILKFILGKNIILIGELPDSYDDSGSVLFEELQKAKRSFKYYYVTNREDLLSKNKEFVKFGSLKHRILFLTSNILLNVQNIDLYMNPFMNRNDKYVAKRNSKDTLLYLAFSKYLVNQKRIFLQHGVLYHSGLTNAIYINSDFDYLVVSTEFEKQVFPQYGREFVESCLPRFSRYNKKNIKKKKILFSPTWRKYFKNLNDGSLDIDLIKQSEYYIRILEILTSEQLNSLLKKYNYELIYNVHHTMKDIINKEMNNINLPSNIKFKEKHISLNELINECDICITDYSSLFFDFLWQNKKVINYIHDYEEFHNRKDNNKKQNSYFNLKNYKYITKVNDLEELLAALEQALTEQYEVEYDNIFFDVNDPCKFIIKKIENILNLKK